MPTAPPTATGTDLVGLLTQTVQRFAGRPLRAVVLLIDARHGIKPVDEEIMSLLDSSAVTFQCVLTKADKVKAKDRVLYDKYAGSTIKVGGEEQLIIKMSDILAVIE